MRAVERLARHAEIVVVHDTQQPSYGWPTDWEQSKNSENPVWGGRWPFLLVVAIAAIIAIVVAIVEAIV